ncbi:tartronate semialdehyde reductase [Escherichia coli]|nr:tartronate semialdehyde reductase [Escherichia coli]
MIKRTFNPGFKIALHHKDLNLALQSAKALVLNLPNPSTCQESLQPCPSNGGRKFDYTSSNAALSNM